MTDELQIEDVKTFIRQLHSKYEEKVVIRDLCDVDVYVERDPQQQKLSGVRWTDDPAEEIQFRQIGQRTKFPISIIREHQLNEMNIQNIVRGIVLGERNYLISRLDQNKSMSEVQSDQLDIDEFIEISGQVRSPDNLILPLRDDLRDMRRDWRQSSNYYFRSNEFVVANGEIIKIHWYPPEKDDNVEGYGYLINSDAIKMTQKWHGDSSVPEGFEHDKRYDKFSRNRPLMIYLGDKIEIDEEADSEKLRKRIDFLYRTVWSEPDIDSDGVLRFRV